MTSEIRLLKPDQILANFPQEKIAGWPLYNQPFFCELIKPGKLRYAQVESADHQTHFFPLSTDRLFLKRRVFILPYCQRFTPFTRNDSPLEAAQLKLWLEWLNANTSTCQWAFDADVVPNGLMPKINQIIRLEQDADTLFSKWKKGRRSALSKSGHLRTELLSEKEFRIELKNLNLSSNNGGWSPDAFEQAAILRLSEGAESRLHIERYGVYHGKDCLSLVLLMNWQNRIHYLFSQSSARGFEQDSLTRFFYFLTETKSGSSCIFDFEGSSLPGVNAFFRSLGAEEEPYWEFRKGL